MNCFAKANQMILFHRDSGVRGAQAQTMLDDYKKNKLLNDWTELPRTPLLPIPINPLPSPPRYKSPLESCYQPKRKSPAADFSQKRRRTEETFEQPDWYHDPVEIKLFSPEEEKPISAGLDQSWPGMSFPAPETLTISDEDENDLKIKSLCVKVPKDEKKDKRKKEKENKRNDKSKSKDSHTNRHSENKNHTTSKNSKCTKYSSQ